MSPGFLIAILIAVIVGALIVFGSFNSQARQYISNFCAPARNGSDNPNSGKGN